jgi:phage shock protein A
MGITAMDDDSKQHKGFKIFDNGDDPTDPEEELLLSDDDLVPPSEIPAGGKDSRKSGSGGVRGFFTALLVIAALGGLGGLAYFGYEHLNERLNHIEAAGAHEVADLSNEIDARMNHFYSGFAAQHAEMQAQIENLLKLSENNARALESMKASMEASSQSLSKNISGMEKKIGDVSTRLSSLESDTSSRIGDLEKRLGPLADAVSITRQQVTGEIEELKKVIGNMDTRLGAFSKQIDALEPEVLLARIQEMNRDLTRKIEAVNNRVNMETGALEEKISAMEALIKSLRNLALPQNQSPEIIEQELQ